MEIDFDEINKRQDRSDRNKWKAKRFTDFANCGCSNSLLQLWKISELLCKERVDATRGTCEGNDH